MRRQQKGRENKTKQSLNNNNEKVNGKYMRKFFIFKNCLGFDVASCHTNWTANAITWANGEQEKHVKLLYSLLTCFYC